MLALSHPTSLLALLSTTGTRSLRSLAVSACFPWLGCADSVMQPIVEHRVPSTSDAGDEEEEDADPADDESGDECVDGDTESCACPNGTSEGERHCRDGYFGICSGCPAIDEMSKCVAGVYEGPFTGIYNGGIPDVFAFYPYEVKATMRLSLNDAIGEFATIGDGCMRSGDQGEGMAGWITGTVDCGTGELAGVLRAYYNMRDWWTGEPFKVFFKGKISATYNAATQSFEDGKWSGAEPKGAINMAGGDGEWKGTIGGDLDPTSGSMDECLGETFPEPRFK
jgi:hypothetical protein